MIHQHAPPFVDPVIIGPSLAMANVLTAAARVAGGTAKVLITGESGVGKDLVARFVHGQSPRRKRPFIALNCAGLSETLLETELFGHVRGSFTGAFKDKAGKLQLADHGTVFLDEVGEMSLRMQAMLLRFLENGEVHPVGSDAVAGRVDVRVISATNRDLARMVDAKEFREDLFYRIRVVHLHVPPLRERIEDIAPLLEHLFACAGHAGRMSEEAMAILLRHPWAGNVRELQNVVEHISSLLPGQDITVADLPVSLAPVVGAFRASARERRRQRADELYQSVVSGESSFWTHIYTAFMSRDITRTDVRGLMQRGLAETGGSYRKLIELFGLARGDYKRFLNFLATHGCAVDYREFRRPGVPAR